MSRYYEQEDYRPAPSSLLIYYTSPEDIFQKKIRHQFSSGDKLTLTDYRPRVPGQTFIQESGILQQYVGSWYLIGLNKKTLIMKPLLQAGVMKLEHSMGGGRQKSKRKRNVRSRRSKRVY